MMNYNVNAITTKSAPIVRRVLHAYNHYGVPGLVHGNAHGRYKYVIQSLWDGSQWRACIARIPMDSIEQGRLEPANNGFGSYHYVGTAVYAYID